MYCHQLCRIIKFDLTTIPITYVVNAVLYVLNTTLGIAKDSMAILLNDDINERCDPVSTTRSCGLSIQLVSESIKKTINFSNVR